MTVIAPQPGPQTEFLQTPADIAFYGGSAGSGKSFALLLDPLYHHDNPHFNAVIFRRSTVQVRNPGGLWDESFELYSKLGAHPREAFLEWIFPEGMCVKMAHLEHEKTVYDWQGSQLAWIGWDELVHFTERQFTYMLSRLRSMSGIPGRIRATMNPDVDSWVRTWIDWYIGTDGFPIRERSGVIRYFIRIDDRMIWGDSSEELTKQYGSEVIPKSFTFIPAKLEDNQILMRKDPGYLSNLLALSRVDRMRLREGNWNVRASAGMMFRREWFPVIDALPNGWVLGVRFWDRAATKPNEENKDPDWTRGLKLFVYSDNTFVIADLRSDRDTPGKIEQLVRSVAGHDGQGIRIKSQQDPGSAGVGEAEHFTKMLAGHDVRTETMPRDKITRAKPVSAQCEAGNVKVLRAPWNDEFFTELENFPEGAHDDCVDVLSGAFNELCDTRSILDIL